MENNVSTGTVVRTTMLVLALVNQVLDIAGYNLIPIDDELINAAVTNVWTIVAALVAWWKNNSFTKAAIAGDQTMKEIKGG